MEKDHFLDRHPLVNNHNSVLPGDEVFICLKNMQPYAKELQDLTKITVTNYLTSQDYHPRGQKVKGYETIWDEEKQEYIQEEQVGRITYKIINRFLVPTTEGIKYIERKGKRLKLSTYEEIKDKLLLFIVLGFKEFSFMVCLDEWRYFNNQDEVKSYLQTITISEPKLFQDRITLIMNNRLETYKNIKIFSNQKEVPLTLENFFSALVIRYPAANNSVFDFNKFYELSIDSFESRKQIEYELEC